MVTDNSQAKPMSPNPSLALCFMVLGLGYALPFAALPETNGLQVFKAEEVVNLYALVAWMGLAHFYFAFKGQGTSFIRRGLTRQGLIFAGTALLTLIGLALTRHFVGFAIFNALTWIYFIPHFIKAELFFSKKTTSKSKENWIYYIFPTIAFTYFSVVLFARHWFFDMQWLVVVLALIVVLICLPLGLLRSLKAPPMSAFTLLGAFILAEGLVWGTYGKYMHSAFADGVYTFHVAAASFYHYFRSYHFPTLWLDASKRRGFWLQVFAVNIGLCAIGYVFLNYFGGSFLNYLLDPYWFTVWVAWHLVCSDTFPILRSR